MTQVLSADVIYRSLRKIGEWQAKAKKETNPFNKYVSLYIGFNIFCNLYESTKNPDADLDIADKKKVEAALEVVTEPNRLYHLLESELQEYVKLIPIFREEYWTKKEKQLKKNGIAVTLKDAINRNDSLATITALLRWLYKVRCNLFHGEKDPRDSDQGKLLTRSSVLLRVILDFMIDSYRSTYL